MTIRSLISPTAKPAHGIATTFRNLKSASMLTVKSLIGVASIMLLAPEIALVMEKAGIKLNPEDIAGYAPLGGLIMITALSLLGKGKKQ